MGPAAAAQASCAGRRPNCGDCAGRSTRGAHPKHFPHGCDLGRVEAQRLVERLRLLPRRKGSMWEEGRHAGPGDGRGVGPAAAQAVCAGRTPNCRGCAGRGTRGAHIKHELHVCDAGRVPAQRLVERPRVLPRRKGSMWEERGRRHAGPGDERGSVCREEPNCGGCAGRGTRGAHIKRAHHGCNAGRVPAQRLVERRRFLPRRKGSMWEEGRHAGPGDGRGVWGGGGGASSVRREDTQLRRLCWQWHGAHRKHALHGCDAGRVPARDVCVKRC